MNKQNGDIEINNCISINCPLHVFVWVYRREFRTDLVVAFCKMSAEMGITIRYQPFCFIRGHFQRSAAHHSYTL